MKKAIPPSSLPEESIAAWENEGGVSLPDPAADAPRDPGRDAHQILSRLGLSVVAHWKHPPRQVRKTIFADRETTSPAEARDLKEKIARFLHDTRHDPRTPYRVRPWPPGTMTF